MSSVIEQQQYHHNNKNFDLDQSLHEESGLSHTPNQPLSPNKMRSPVSSRRDSIYYANQSTSSNKMIQAISSSLESPVNATIIQASSSSPTAEAFDEKVVPPGAMVLGPNGTIYVAGLTPNSKGSFVDPSRLKSRMCRHHNPPVKDCPFGDRCVFAHTEQELQDAANGIVDIEKLRNCILEMQARNLTAEHAAAAVSAAVNNHIREYRQPGTSLRQQQQNQNQHQHNNRNHHYNNEQQQHQGSFNNNNHHQQRQDSANYFNTPLATPPPPRFLQNKIVAEQQQQQQQSQEEQVQQQQQQQQQEQEKQQQIQQIQQSFLSSPPMAPHASSASAPSSTSTSASSVYLAPPSYENVCSGKELMNFKTYSSSQQQQQGKKTSIRRRWMWNPYSFSEGRILLTVKS